MALNLIRNSKVFFTTNVDTDGKLKLPASTAYTNANTFEIQVLDGFTFSQNTNKDTVTLNEAGPAPVRGQRSFNTSLAPVDFSFSTYIRPKNATTKITAEESVLWNALLSNTAIGTPTSLTATTVTVTASATGVVTISATGTLATLPTVGDVIVLSGIATTTPAGHDPLLNGPGRVLTSTATSVTVQLFNFPTVAVTATTLVTANTVRYSKWAWNESTTTYSQATAGLSEVHQLQKFGMLFLVDNVLYGIQNCALNQAVIDFGLDGIATVQWSGQATQLTKLSDAVTASGGNFTGGGANDVGAGGTYLAKVEDAKYITNKLSTLTLTATKTMGTNFTAGDAYSIAITGGSITINNNITYITPANLGVVNTPVTYYTGTRAITGSVNAYLRTGGSKDTGELLSDMLAESSIIEPMFTLDMNIGGANTTRVALNLPAVTLSIPTVDVQQVVSTTISFTAQGYTPSATAGATKFSIDVPSDIAVRYYAA